MNIVPFNENILIRPFPTQEKTESGVIIPKSAQERPSKATILAVSEELIKRLQRENVSDDRLPKEGNIVHHVKNCGVPVIENEELLYMVRYQECLYKED